MSNETTVPDPIVATPGLQTTSGQFTAIFTVVALALSALGFHYSADQVSTWTDEANKFLSTLGPILALIPVLITYINSRGKIASNTAVANATVQAAALAPPPPPAPIAGQILSTTESLAVPVTSNNIDFKDPATYEGLLNLASELGVPGVAPINAIVNKTPVVGDAIGLISGILNIFHKKTATIPVPPAV